MKKIFLALCCFLPLMMTAQTAQKKSFTFTAISLSEDGSNPEFYRNFKMGIVSYNKAVELINNSQGEKTNAVSASSHDGAIQEFKNALPYLEKAYSINPKNEKILNALQGTYVALSDDKKSEQFKAELDALKK